ncbi:phytoene desaturase family protein [Nocardioides sp. GXQ0305]|uniref:phytoene desaturase family protein n=1 Tax=Nocardioides sp. GXQ0305 TaxID=3423912 RepID=UPI003D7DA92E
MTETVDFVIAGGGHNSLITAAYLARAGYSCVVLDARSIPGGGAASEELLDPGYRFDSCSTGHTLIQANPLLADDELRLLADYGLVYDMPDPIAHVVLPDGSPFTSWLDLDRTVEQFARYSRTDAETYRRMIEDYGAISGLVRDASFTPPGYGTPLPTALEQHPRGGRWLRRRLMTAADVIDREFENEHVKAYLAWQAFQTAQPIDGGGTGMLAISIQAGRQKRSWTIPRGGSGALTDALVRCLDDLGVTVVCDTTVTELVLEGGSCVGVRTADGETYCAREGVVSTIHVRHLTEMAPREAWDDDWLFGISTYDLGLSAFAIYLETDAPPVFETEGVSQAAVSAGTVGWLRDVVQYGRDLKDGRFVTEVPWLLVATPTLVDPSRAPEGHHTVKLLSMQQPDPPEGTSWEEAKEEHAQRQLAHIRRIVPNLAEEHVVGRLVKSPRDIERGNRHMVDGSFHGGERGIAQIGGLRPAPRWGQHRTPIPGLYQTGATTHPGGSITGAPGRNAARVILDDRGSSLAEVIASRPRAVAR